MNWTLPQEAIDEGWTMRLSDRWPQTDPKSKTVYFRAVLKGEVDPYGGAMASSFTADEVLCHELAHVHLEHSKVGMGGIFRSLENEARAYVWARGMPAPREAWTDQKPLCRCSIDAIADHLDPTELKLAYRWIGSCRHA